MVELLKEQDELGTELTNAVELIHKKNERIEKLLKEKEEVVRCKDCEHCYFASNRTPDERSYACGKHGIDIVQDWFCADGERK